MSLGKDLGGGAYGLTCLKQLAHQPTQCEKERILFGLGIFAGIEGETCQDIQEDGQ